MVLTPPPPPRAVCAPPRLLLCVYTSILPTCEVHEEGGVILYQHSRPRFPPRQLAVRHGWDSVQCAVFIAGGIVSPKISQSHESYLRYFIYVQYKTGGGLKEV